MCYIGKSPPHCRKQGVNSWRIVCLFGFCRIDCRITVLPLVSSALPGSFLSRFFQGSCLRVMSHQLGQEATQDLVRLGNHVFPWGGKPPILFQSLCYLFITSRSISTDLWNRLPVMQMVSLSFDLPPVPQKNPLRLLTKMYILFQNKINGTQ